MVEEYRIVYSRHALKDAKKLSASNLAQKAKKLITLIKDSPFATNPRYEKLVGDLEGAYSRRINIQHRLVYQVDEENRVIKILRMWTHYE